MHFTFYRNSIWLYKQELEEAAAIKFKKNEAVLRVI